VAAHCYARLSFASPDHAGLLCGSLDIRHVFSSVLSDVRTTRPLMAWSGQRTAAPRSPGPQRRRWDFLPLGFAHSSRGKKVSPPPSSASLRPEDGCVVDRLRPADRHRGRDGRGLEHQGEV